MSSPKNPIVIRPRREPPILICKKCLRRCDDGSDIKRQLKSELKRGADGGLKPAKVIATACFGICPKRAVVLASGASLARGEYVLISTGDHVPEALTHLRNQAGNGTGSGA